MDLYTQLVTLSPVFIAKIYEGWGGCFNSMEREGHLWIEARADIEK